MPSTPLRYKRLINEIPKHDNARDALLASGFPASTANKQSKRVLQKALKHQAQEILKAPIDPSQGSKRLMSEIVGISSTNLFERLKYIANQDKDLSSALKVIAPLVKEHGVILSQDDDKANITIPVINLGFAPVKQDVLEQPQPLDNGSTKP